MNKIYRSLEFDVILSEISSLSSFSLAKEKILALTPYKNKLALENKLTLMSEMLEMLNENEQYEVESIIDVSKILQQVNKDMVISGVDLLNVKKVNDAVISIKNKIKSNIKVYPNIKEVVDSLENLNDLSKVITTTINSNGEVYLNASSELKSLIKQLDQVNTTLKNVVNQFMKKHKDKLAENISSERNDRAVVLLNASYKNSIKGVVFGESKSGLSVYFEPDAFISLNNTKQSLNHLILQEIEKILFELSQEVKKYSSNILGNLNTLALLDMTLAIGKWGYQRDGIVSEISFDNAIYLKDVAHPLIDLKKVVRNTYKIGKNKTLIVSGPNTGGKTVTLKTIGLSILMTMCGIPILASSGKLPIVDNIFIDLGDQQSVVSSLSTFSSQLTQLSYIVNNVSENSLVILDELGGNTDPKEGEALAIAILQYLKSKKAITLVSTHLANLKKFAQSEEDIILAGVEFDQQTLSPTYRYVEGLAGQSNALEIAAKFDFPKSLMDNAKSLKQSFLTDEEKLMEVLTLKEKELYNKELELEAQIKQLEKEKQAHQEELVVEKEKLKLANKKAVQEASEYILNRQKEIDDLYEEMKAEFEFSNLTRAIQLKKTSEDLIQQESEKMVSDHKFVVGDKVLVEGFNVNGEIISLNNNNVEVLINGLNVKTKLNKLTFVSKKVKKPKRVGYQVRTFSKFKNELNVIGKSEYEALNLVDKFIDNSIAHKVQSVVVIHGVGKQILKKAIEKYLHNSSKVDSFNQALPNQGGAGATVIKLK